MDHGPAGSSESLGLWPADALSAGLAISAPSAPAEPCLAGSGASSPVGDGAGLSRGAAAPWLPAGGCLGMMMPGAVAFARSSRRVYT